MPDLNTAMQPAAPARSPANLIRSWLGNRVALAIAGIAATVAGLGLGWDWLTAIGAAPLNLSGAPCLVMCALGICMMGKGRQSSSGPQTPQDAQLTAPPQSSTER
jgi:hypothetical protein